MNLLVNGPETAPVTVLLAHGAGAPMDSAWMNVMSDAFATAGLRIARFEFGYMAARRSGYRKPPPRAESLIPEYLKALEQLRAERPLIIGGRSMGGRVASIIADDLYGEGKIFGLLCLGYPFHPPGKIAQLRTNHLTHLKTPTLIGQGTRDPFGSRDEVSDYELSDQIEILWLEDGDHDLKPRTKVSGFTVSDHLQTLAREVRDWADRILP